MEIVKLVKSLGRPGLESSSSLSKSGMKTTISLKNTIIYNASNVCNSSSYKGKRKQVEISKWFNRVLFL